MRRRAGGNGGREEIVAARGQEQDKGDRGGVCSRKGLGAVRQKVRHVRAKGGVDCWGGVKACKAAGLEPVTCPSQRRDDGSGSADGEAGRASKSRTDLRQAGQCMSGWSCAGRGVRDGAKAGAGEQETRLDLDTTAASI